MRTRCIDLVYVSSAVAASFPHPHVHPSVRLPHYMLDISVPARPRSICALQQQTVRAIEIDPTSLSDGLLAFDSALWERAVRLVGERFCLPALSSDCLSDITLNNSDVTKRSVQ